MQNPILLIFPPFAKACEPPAGITRIAGYLKANNQQCLLWDANIEAQLYLLHKDQSPEDTWSRRAWKNRVKNLQELKTPELYTNQDRYQRAVRDCNRVLLKSSDSPSISISLADYQDSELSPHQSKDLLQAAKEYDKSIFFPLYRERISKLINDATDSFIGISLNYLSQALPAFGLAGYLREEFPQCKLIVGGGLITSWLRSPDWSNPFGNLFDHMIEGEGELPLLKILGHGEAIDYAVPTFDDLPRDDYLAPGLVIPYAASTGCYWNRCSFCPEKAEGSGYSQLSSQQVVDDLKVLKEQYKPAMVHLLDNAVAPALMRKMIQESPGVPWYGFSRVNDELTDAEFCQQLRHSGCVMLKLGIESGSQQVLDTMDKGIDLEKVEKALAALHSAGIMTYVYLLFGTPAETLPEARKTLEFTVRNAEYIGFLNLAVFNLPLNSTEVNSLHVREFSDGDLGLYSDFVHPKGWSRKLVRTFLAEEFKVHPDIRPILHRDPPFFTSNHAPFIGRLAFRLPSSD